MKSALKAFWVLCAMISLSLFVGCTPDYGDGGGGGDDNGNNNSIVGTWENINDLTETYVFNSDGTGTWAWSGTSSNFTSDFTYVVNGEFVICNYLFDWTDTLIYTGETLLQAIHLQRVGVNSGSVVGIWEWEYYFDYDSSTMTIDIVFNSNGTGFKMFCFNDDDCLLYDFTYSVAGKTITVYYAEDDESAAIIYNGETISWITGEFRRKDSNFSLNVNNGERTVRSVINSEIRNQKRGVRAQ